MSREEFDRFRTVVLADTSLQARLRNGPAAAEDFVGRAVSLGVERGFAFTSEDVSDALRDAQREWMERWVR
jgi:hypothetical protein